MMAELMSDISSRCGIEVNEVKSLLHIQERHRFWLPSRNSAANMA